MNQYNPTLAGNIITEEKSLGNNIYIVAHNVWRLKDKFVNMFIIQDNLSGKFILVDAGLESSASKIKKMISTVIMPGAKPASIVMTHGHFDHRGALKTLLDEWQVPVFAHHKELPFLDGRSSYPPADPSVGGGAMATFSFLYPKKPIDVSEHLMELPADKSVPGMPEWRWIHTPGHTPGHISLYRDEDGVLIAGDAFVTTNQESVFSVMSQHKKICGPPKYFTPDWSAAARSVKELAELDPLVVTTGHGQSIYGDEAISGLSRLARNFWEKAIPSSGRYVREPALFNDDGVKYLPPSQVNLFKTAIAIGLVIGFSMILFKKVKRKKQFKLLRKQPQPHMPLVM